jgi:hypothetical protein
MNTASERHPDHAARYLDITAAHRALAAIGKETDQLAAKAKACPFEDATDLERPLYDALALHLDAAAAVVTGERSPVIPTAIDYDYAGAVAEALDGINELALTIARRAFQVRQALDNGLITKPLTWTADDINEGRMLASLANGYDDTDYDWYAFDAMHLEGCVNALARERLFEFADVSRDTYDRHMARIEAVAGVVGDKPAGTAEHVRKALDEWKAEEAAADAALSAPSNEAAKTLRARQAIHNAPTYARLAAFAADITGPAWDGERRKADKHMALLYETANKMGTDAYGNSPKSEVAADLFAMLDEWRIGAYAARMKAVREVYGADAREDYTEDQVKAAETTAYYALYDACDLATSTGQLLDVWNGAEGLDAGHRENIRVGVLLRFEESRTGTGCPLVDGGAFADHTKRLRTAVDEYPIGFNSNITHTVNYRALRAALDGVSRVGADPAVKLVHAWRAVVDADDADTITRRQLGALRDLANAKVAELCDGDENRARGLLTRLPEWERIRHELKA